MKYGTDVIFEGNKLFSGAIDIDWLYSNRERAYEAARAHVFHGPKYHYIDSEDQSQKSSKFTDSITMTKNLLKTLNTNNNNRIVLSIAGYGAGKSHLALTLSLLFSRDKNVFQKILDEIKDKDEKLYEIINSLLNNDCRPYLVIPVNGMNNASLKDLIFDNISFILDYNGDSKECLNQFDQRYAYLKNTVKTHVMQNKIAQALNKCGFETVDEFVSKMDQYDEDALNIAYDVLSKENIELFMPASKGELRDLVTTVACSLCGTGKKYRGLVLVFDEFGKYMSFAAANEAIAGQGALQQLFEGIQGIPNDIPVVMWGLSQLDLQQYQQTTTNANFSNNMNRYVTRYSIADKYYLSVCFESLLANLISKPKIHRQITLHQASDYRKTLNQLFPMTLQYPLWTDNNAFLDAICDGGWPLSPLSVWTLTYITSVNNMLQQRSGFAILNNTFANLEGSEILQDNFSIFPVDLFRGGLGTEFIASENSKTSPDTIATEYDSVISKYGQKLSEVQIRVLQSIVLAYKLKANCKTELQTKITLSFLSNVKTSDVTKALDFLINELNCVYFNPGLKLYEIKSDSATSLEFKRFIENRIIEFYKNNTEDRIYNTVGKILRENSDLEVVRNEVFEDVECDFSFNNDIASVEWFYESIIITGTNYLPQTKIVIDTIKKNPPVAYNEPKGKMVYYILPSSIGLKQAMKELSSVIVLEDNPIPIIGLVLHDKGNIIKDLSIELAVIDKLSTVENDKFDNIITKRKRDIKNLLLHKLLDMKCDSNRIYPIIAKKPRFIAGSRIFEVIYPKHISFDIDGIRQENSTGLKTVNDFCNKLASPDITWNDFLTLQSKDVNRAKSLLERGWQIFDNNGKILRYPKYQRIKLLFNSIDEQVKSLDRYSIYALYTTLTLPPFGCNTTQATILLFVYFAGRSKEIEFEKDGKIITLTSLLETKTSFDSKTYSLSKSVWERVYFNLKITDDVLWFNLLQDWNSNHVLSENEEFNIKSIELSKKVKVPSQYVESLNNLRERLFQSNDKYKTWSNENKKFIEKIEQLIITNDIDQLSCELVQYIKTYKEIFDKIPLKNSIVIEDFKLHYKEYKQLLLNNVNKWVEKNKLDRFFDDKVKFDNLKSKYLVLNKALLDLGQRELADEIKELTSTKITECSTYRRSISVLSNIEEKCLYLNSEIDKGGINLSLAIKYKNEIQDLSEQCKSITSNIVIGLEKYSLLVSEMNESLNKLNTLLEKKQNEVQFLESIEIKTIEDIDNIEEIVTSLFSFYPTDYVPCESIIVILRKAKSELSELKRVYWDIVRDTQDYPSAEILVKNKKNDFYRMWGEKPIFKYDKFLDNCLIQTKNLLLDKSKNWINNQKNNIEKSTSLDDYLRVSHNLEYLPTYLSPEDSLRAKRYKELVNQQISKKKVDYIIKLCKDLDKDELNKVSELILELL